MVPISPAAAEVWSRSCNDCLTLEQRQHVADSCRKLENSSYVAPERDGAPPNRRAFLGQPPGMSRNSRRRKESRRKMPMCRRVFAAKNRKQRKCLMKGQRSCKPRKFTDRPRHIGGRRFEGLARVAAASKQKDKGLSNGAVHTPTRE